MDLSSDISAPSSDSSTEAAPSQPRKKRARVTFEMDLPSESSQERGGQSGLQNNVTAMSAPSEKSAALVREEVRRSIQRHLAGDSDAYDRIKEIFTADPTALEDDGTPVYDLPTDTSLKNHLQGLQANVAALDGNCNGLVYAVLSSHWVGRDEKYVKQFVRFLGTLAVAKGAFLNSVLKMLVGNLRQRECLLRLCRFLSLAKIADCQTQLLAVLDSYLATPSSTPGRFTVESILPSTTLSS